MLSLLIQIKNDVNSLYTIVKACPFSNVKLSYQSLLNTNLVMSPLN